MRTEERFDGSGRPDSPGRGEHHDAEAAPRGSSCSIHSGDLANEADLRDLRGRDSSGERGADPSEQESLGLMDLTVERNGYGRQIDSRVVQVEPPANFADRTAPGAMEAVFIRAPDHS